MHAVSSTASTMATPVVVRKKKRLVITTPAGDTVIDGRFKPTTAWLAYFVKYACIPAEHESAAKQIIYARIFGLAHLRGFATRAPIFQMMQSLTIKRTIWRFFDVAKPVELKVEIVTPPTSEFNSTWTVINMLAGTEVWFTKHIPAHQVESVVLGVAAGSRLTSFDVASVYSTSEKQMCVEEVAADGTIGATLIAWKHYGTYSGNWSKPSNYTPATIAVETTATRFKVSVRHTRSFNSAGVAIFRATGVVP